MREIMARKTTKREKAFFFSHAAWLVPQLADPSRRGLIVWVAEHLEGDERHNLAQQLRLSHPDQHYAEEALKNFLDTSSPTVRRARMNRTNNLTRHVDWPTTYERALYRPPLEYYERKPAQFPDEQLISALLGLADSWGRLHRALGDEGRARKLLALGAKRANIRRRGVAYNHRLSQRLRQIDSETAEAIEGALRLLDAVFGAHEDDQKVFRELPKKIHAEQSDVLLELIVLLCIARAAEQSKWEVEVEENTEQRMPHIVLSKGGLQCSLSKEKPRKSGGQDNQDRISYLRKLMGNDGSTGHEPDITLKFWREEDQKHVYVLGDAKRNVADDGQNYIGRSVEAAVSYLAAYGHLMGVKPTQNHDDPFDCEISPAFTLFFLKGINQINGRGAGQAAAQFRRAADGHETAQLPSVTAFGLNHLGNTNEQGQWEASDVLKSWFKCVAQQADRHLRGA